MATHTIQPTQPDAGIAVEHVQRVYEYPETRALVALVDAAAALVLINGEAAFADFRIPGSRWRHKETYIFVLNTDGRMLVHPDPAMEGSDQIALKDIAGRPIVRGLISAATTPSKPEGWYHYQWPVPGGLQPRWKSSYVRLVDAQSGKRYIVGSGMYNDWMERAFVLDMIAAAAARIEHNGEAAFPVLRDPTGPFLAKDAYVFVVDPEGVELVNPVFPTLEGKNLAGMKDAQGRFVIREMLDLVRTRGAGWIDYMWPKPGDRVATQKSAYVRKATIGGKTYIVGSGVYLP